MRLEFDVFENNRALKSAYTQSVLGKSTPFSRIHRRSETQPILCLLN